MIRGFLIALFLAAVFSAMAFPIFRRISAAFAGRKGLAAGATLALLLAVILLPGFMLLQIVVEQAQDIGQNALPWLQGKLHTTSGVKFQLPQWLPFRGTLQEWLPTVASKLGELSGKIGGFIVQAISAVTSGTARFFLDLFVLIAAMFYFLKEGPEILAALKSYAVLPASVQDRVFERVVVVTRSTMKGTLVIGIVQGALGGIGFLMFAVQGAAFWGVVMAIASMLPLVGTSLIWIPAVIYLLAVGETTAAVGLLLWSAIIVSNIDNVLRPILVGGEAEMPDVLVLMSTFGGLAMFGAAGLILGPVIASVCVTLLEITHDLLRQSGAEDVAAADAAPGRAAVVAEAGQSAPTDAGAPGAAPSGSGHGSLEVGLTQAQKDEVERLRADVDDINATKVQK